MITAAGYDCFFLYSWKQQPAMYVLPALFAQKKTPISERLTFVRLIKAYPFTAPLSIPSIKFFWNIKKKASTGINASIAPNITAP